MDEFISSSLNTIRQNLGNLSVENVTEVQTDLNLLEELLKIVFNKESESLFLLLNSTLMKEQTYAQNVFTKITSWYLQKLENATSGSEFASYVQPFKHTVEMIVASNAVQSNFSNLVSNQIQSLINNIQAPLDVLDLNRIINMMTSLVQGELETMKTSFKIQQDFYTSMGLQLNLSEANISTEVEAHILKYLNVVKTWMSNSNLKFTLDHFLQWNGTNITSAGMDLEQMMNSTIHLLSPEERSYAEKLLQVSQALNYALQVGSTQDGLQSKNFTQAILDAARLAIGNFLNGSTTLPWSDLDQVSELFQIILELILNQNISYTQVQGLLQQAILSTDQLVQELSPETAQMLAPRIQNLKTSIKSQSRGTNNWNQM